MGNESNEIVLIARRGTSLDFDIAPLPVRYYDTLTELRELIAGAMSEMIRLTR